MAIGAGAPAFDHADWRGRSIKQSFYDYWLETEGIPVYRGNFVADVHTLELDDWPRMGGRGAYLSLANHQVTNGYVADVRAAGALNPEVHAYDEIIYDLAGCGSSQVGIE